MIKIDPKANMTDVVKSKKRKKTMNENGISDLEKRIREQDRHLHLQILQNVNFLTFRVT